MQILFEQLRALQHRIEKNDSDLENSLHHYEANEFEKLTNEEDAVYKEYFTLINENFTKEALTKVNDKIGHGKFLDPMFIITLEEIIASEKQNPLATYDGYKLYKGKDNFGCETYFIYNQDHHKVEETFDFIDDESAIRMFHKMVDSNDFYA